MTGINWNWLLIRNRSLAAYKLANYPGISFSQNSFCSFLPAFFVADSTRFRQRYERWRKNVNANVNDSVCFCPTKLNWYISDFSEPKCILSHRGHPTIFMWFNQVRVFLSASSFIFTLHSMVEMMITFAIHCESMYQSNALIMKVTLALNAAASYLWTRPLFESDIYTL